MRAHQCATPVLHSSTNSDEALNTFKLILSTENSFQFATSSVQYSHPSRRINSTNHNRGRGTVVAPCCNYPTGLLPPFPLGVFCPRAQTQASGLQHNWMAKKRSIPIRVHNLSYLFFSSLRAEGNDSPPRPDLTCGRTSESPVLV